jgi:glycosyltransferase involved in cell wall biosynthesis
VFSLGKLKKIAIFSHVTPDHINWVLGLRQGFQSLGVDVLTSWPHPSGEMLNSIIENWRPDAILEINRSKDQIEGLNHEVFHINLIHDFRSHERVFTETSGQSDLYYSIIQPSHFGFPEELDARTKAFMPGANTVALQYAKPQEKKYDLGFIGHMVTPYIFSKALFTSPLDPQKKWLGTFGDLVKDIGIDQFTLNQSTYVIDLRKKIESYFHERGETDFHYEMVAGNGQAGQLCVDSLVRGVNRRYLSNAMLNVSNNIAFWGSNKWLEWPKYAPYYRGEILSTPSLFEAYSSLKINIHCTGTNLHIRISDSMAMGVPTAVMNNNSDSTLFGIEQFFEPDVDFIRFDFSNFKEKINYFLKEPLLLKEMGARCQKKMLNQYRWVDQCSEIVNDVNQIL